MPPANRVQRFGPGALLDLGLPLGLVEVGEVCVTLNRT